MSLLFQTAMKWAYQMTESLVAFFGAVVECYLFRLCSATTARILISDLLELCLFSSQEDGWRCATYNTGRKHCKLVHQLDYVATMPLPWSGNSNTTIPLVWMRSVIAFSVIEKRKEKEKIKNELIVCTLHQQTGWLKSTFCENKNKGERETIIILCLWAILSRVGTKCCITNR